MADNTQDPSNVPNAPTSLPITDLALQPGYKPSAPDLGFPVGHNITSGGITYVSNGDGTFTPQRVPTPTTAADINLANNRAYFNSSRFQTINGITYVTVPDPNIPGQAKQNADGTPILLQVGPDGLGQAALNKLIQETGLTAAQADQINASIAAGLPKAQAGLATAQTGLTNVQTEAAKQQLMGQFSTAASQIVSGPGDAASKQKMIDALYNNTINQYNDVVNKSAALNTYNKTLADQASQRTQTAANFSSSLGDKMAPFAKYGGAPAGAAIGNAANMFMPLMAAIGGNKPDLQNPLSLWANGGSGIDQGTVPTLGQLFSPPTPGGVTPGGPPPTGGGGGGGNGNNNKPAPPASSQSLMDAWNSGASGALNRLPSSNPSDGPPPVSSTGAFTPNSTPGGTQTPYGFAQQFPSSPDPNLIGLQPTAFGSSLAGAMTTPNGFDQSINDALMNNNTFNAPPGNGDFITNLLGRVGGVLNSNNSPLPGYAKGGTVPGVPGQPQLAVVHGGEKITPNPVKPEHMVTPAHITQIKQQIARGMTPLQAVLNVHALSGGDPAELLKSVKVGKK